MEGGARGAEVLGVAMIFVLVCVVCVALVCAALFAARWLSRRRRERAAVDWRARQQAIYDAAAKRHAEHRMRVAAEERAREAAGPSQLEIAARRREVRLEHTAESLESTRPRNRHERRKLAALRRAAR